MRKSIFTLLLIAIIITDTVHAQSVNFEWAKQLGGTLSDAGNSIAVDASGNVYTAGTFAGTVDFTLGTGSPFTSAGGNDIFITSFTAAGNFSWAVQIGGLDADAAGSIAVDGAGNVYVTGAFQGTVDFDPGPGGPFIAAGTAPNNIDIFVAKFDGSNGNLIWAKQMGGLAVDAALAIAVDGSGGVYTTGYFVGPANFDPNGSNILNGFGGLDIFVSKLDATGSYVWAVEMGAGGLTQDFGTGIKIDSDGNVVSTGVFTGVADLDPTGSAATFTAGLNDTYVSKISGVSGAFVWAQQIGGATNEQANGITTDASGNIYLTGFFDGTTDFNPDPTPVTGEFNLITNGGRDIFIAKLTSAGNFVWAKNIGNPGTSGAPDRDIGISIAVDAALNVYTTGSFANTADFDPDGTGVTNLTSAGDRDIFLSILNSAGDFVLATQFGDVAFDQGASIALNPATGNIHITGFFQGSADFNPGSGVATLTSAGVEDIFVLKLSQLIPFPLKLTDFTAKLVNQAVQLQWRTASEENTSHFEIEKSINGTSFVKVGSVKAAGNSSSIKNYSFNNQQPFNGNNYYRLKMIDTDGKFTYSKVVVVRLNGKTALQIFPNPAKNILYVQATGNDKNSLLRITDAGGKIVKEQKIVLNGTTSFFVDITSLPKGLYYFTLKDASKIQQQKIIKQ